MPTLSKNAPAKLNLFLHINGRRPDGYHELQTLFQLVDWCDTLHFTKTSTAHIHVKTENAVISAQDNLVLKAAKLLQQEGKCHHGAEITLEKNLPMGAGIGGGSSDAATTLIALNELWGLNWSTKKLAQLGAKLGADIPVFIFGTSAFAEGIGEKLTPVTLPKRWYIIVIPPCHIDTKTIFEAASLSRNTPKFDLNTDIDIYEKASKWRNDCQSVVLDKYPIVGKVFAELLEYGSPKLTGTGCCVFMDFPSQTAAQTVYEKINQKYACVMVPSINTPPVYACDQMNTSII